MRGMYSTMPVLDWFPDTAQGVYVSTLRLAFRNRLAEDDNALDDPQVLGDTLKTVTGFVIVMS